MQEVPLPDTQRWQARATKSETLERAFFTRCQQIEKLILQRVAHEIDMNIDNYDSGISIEDIIRESFHELLPSRYSVSSGTVTDSLGFTAGDCDIVIFNEQWFPLVKSGATRQSRRRFFPIDGVYGVLEVKQSLTPKTLDDAMEKLVTCKRLYRRSTPRDRIVENGELGSCEHHIRNPLYTGVLATRIQDDIDLNDLLTRFVRINQTLPRRDVVNSLCILNSATVVWGYFASEVDAFTEQYGNLKPALFMQDDLYAELIPVLSGNQPGSSSFAELVSHLITQLYHSVLAPEDFGFNYGRKDGRIQCPTTPEFRLQPDPIIMLHRDGASSVTCGEHRDRLTPHRRGCD